MALAGLSSSNFNMFQNLMPDISPSPNDLVKAEEELRASKSVFIKDVKIETFDLGNAKDAKEYAKRIKDLFMGVQARTHVILCNERQFVKEDGNPRWLVHLEWMEFDLKIKTHPSVPASA